jgi:glucokinase
MNVILGLDFGGTKLAAGLVDPATGRLLSVARCPTPPGGADEGFEAMIELARALQPGDERSSAVGEGYHLAGGDRSPFVTVGVSFGGPVEADGRTVRRSMHVPGWEGLQLADRLEREFGVPVVVANDADAAALAEHRFGAGRGVRHLLYLTASTGIGGGVIIDGRLFRGEHAWAGEIGHMVLSPGGPPCPCGRNGCLEALASGLSIAREARARLPHLNPVDPTAITARDVARAAGTDSAAQAVWNEAMTWLGVGVASAANLLNPGRVVIGGGLTAAGDLLFDPVRREVAARVLDPDLGVVPAALGAEAGVLGGVAVAIEHADS